MVVLYKARGKPGGSVAVGVVALEEEPARVLEHAGLDEQDTLQFGSDHVHGESGKLSR